MLNILSSQSRLPERADGTGKLNDRSGFCPPIVSNWPLAAIECRRRTPYRPLRRCPCPPRLTFDPDQIRLAISGWFEYQSAAGEGGAVYCAAPRFIR